MGLRRNTTLFCRLERARGVLRDYWTPSTRINAQMLREVYNEAVWTIDRSVGGLRSTASIFAYPQVITCVRKMSAALNVSAQCVL